MDITFLVWKHPRPTPGEAKRRTADRAFYRLGRVCVTLPRKK